MDYGEVLGRAWRIIWKHKILWIFGILAGCSRGGGGGNSGYQSSARSGQGPYNGIDQFFTQLSNWISTHLWVVVLIILAVLVLVIIIILLGTIGRIGLIKGTQKADAGAEHLGFAELWDDSLPYFWRVFLLSLFVGIAAFIVAAVVVVLGIGAAALTLGIGLICFLPLLCVLIIVLWFVGLIVQMAESAIVIENLGIMDGLRRGWDVVKTHLGPVLVMWLILLVIGIAIGLLIAIPVLVTIVPAAIAFGLANANAQTLTFGPLIIGLVCCTIYFPFLLVLNGILTAYIQSAWTLTYLRLTAARASLEPRENPENPVVPAPNA